MAERRLRMNSNAERRRHVVSMYSKPDDMDPLAWLKAPPERHVSLTSLKSPKLRPGTNNNNLEIGNKLRRPSSMYFEYTKKQSFADLRSEKTRYMKQKARAYNKVMKTLICLNI